MISENILDLDAKIPVISNKRAKETYWRTHGKYGTKIYQTWNWMIQRCYNKKTFSYKNYGARGIKTCKSWRKFESFYKDMGDPPIGKTLGRINNKLGYSKNNCRWESPKEQARNRKTSRFIKYNKKNKTLAEWSEMFKIHPETISNRIERGWSLEKAFTTKPIKGRNQFSRHSKK